MLEIVVKSSDQSSEFSFSTPKIKEPKVSFKVVEDIIEDLIPANYYIKLNSDIEE